MFKKFLKGLIKLIIVTVMVGTIIWMTSSLYRFVKNRVKGH